MNIQLFLLWDQVKRQLSDPDFIMVSCYPIREALRAGFEPGISGLKDLRRSQFA